MDSLHLPCNPIVLFGIHKWTMDIECSMNLEAYTFFITGKPQPIAAWGSNGQCHLGNGPSFI